MRIPTFLLLLLLLSAHTIAAPLNFTEHNFSVDIPPGWVPISPKPPDTLAAVQSPDGSAKLVIVAANLPTAKNPNAIEEVRAGMKESMIKGGCTFDAEKRLSIGGVPFISDAVHHPSFSGVTYIGVAGDEVYTLMVMSKTRDPAADQALQQAVQSFHLLAAVPTQKHSPLLTKASARVAGAFAGKVIFWGIIVVLVIVVLRSNKAR